MRDSDVAGRFGGDEFIAILPGADAQAVSVVAQRIMHRIRENPDLASMHVTLSLGGASMPSDGDINALLKTADLALYDAKEAGRDRFVINGA